MKQSVILKSNQSGITLVLDKECSFEQILKDTVAVFSENEDFFENSRFAIAFKGRTLTQEEEIEMVLTINNNTKAKVIRITSEDQNDEKIFQHQQQQFDNLIRNNTGKFHKGTLCDKDLLEVDASIVILGDVNEGAKVISKGNIVVLGALKGIAHAGVGGNQEAFVAALKMSPKKLRIADISYVSEEKKSIFSRKNNKLNQPKVAKIVGGRIEVSPLISE